MLPTVEELVDGGLVTLERVRTADDPAALAAAATVPGEEAKATLLLGWRERVEGRPAFRWAVDTLHRHGVAGATVVLGVDGMVHGERRRARFFSRNADVPLTVVSVGAATALTAALGELCADLDRPLFTLERARVCKRDGEAVGEPDRPPSSDPEGLGIWQKLTVYASEQARHGRHPLYVELIHRLRLEGAAGATALRGIWGHSGDHAPHGDRFLALGRQVPIVVTVVDRPEEAARWWDVIDELTDEAGLVTSETVPAFRAVGPGISTGGLRLARLDAATLTSAAARAEEDAPRRRSSKSMPATRKKTSRRPLRPRTPSRVKKRTAKKTRSHHHPELWGLGMAAVGLFLATVLWLGWDGGIVGPKISEWLQDAVGSAAYVLPLVLMGVGGLMLVRSALVDFKPFRTGLVVAGIGLMIALGRDQGGAIGSLLGGGLANGRGGDRRRHRRCSAAPRRHAAPLRGVRRRPAARLRARRASRRHRRPALPGRARASRNVPRAPAPSRTSRTARTCSARSWTRWRATPTSSPRHPRRPSLPLSSCTRTARRT